MARTGFIEAKQQQMLDKVMMDGVHSMGGGRIAKFVMCDHDLSLTAKTIYALLCSYSGGAENMFPCRDNIVSYIGINKDSYYKYLNELVSAGLVEIQKQHSHGGIGKGFERNIYIIKTDVARFTSQLTSKGKRLKAQGIFAGGYGSVPRAVMIDTRISAKAKGLYAYLCAYTGSGSVAFPKKDDILYHVNLSNMTYKKCMNELIDCGYVLREQGKSDSGTFARNNYVLVNTPGDNFSDTQHEDASTPRAKISDTQSSEVSSPKANFSDAQKPDAQKPDTQKPDAQISDTTNNNITTNRQTNNNPSIILSAPVSEKQNERRTEGTAMSSDDEIDYIWQNFCGIPAEYLTHKETIKGIVDLLLGDYEADEMPYFNMAAELLTKMLISSKGTMYRGDQLSQQDVNKILTKALWEAEKNSALRFNEKRMYFGMLKPYIYSAIDALTDAQRTRPVAHVEAYFRSCILDELKNHVINMRNEERKNDFFIRRDFEN